MESLSSKFMISSTLPRFPAQYQINPTHNKSLSLVIRCKKSTYQGFQEYVKPLNLLPATEVKIDGSSVENAIASLSSMKSESLYKIKLQTSKMYGSGLSDLNSGVLLCLIDENGSSILQRLPATSVGTHTLSDDKVVDDEFHFQSGSIDEFAFEGPNLGRIVAVWIGLESGEWRLGGMNLTVISPCNASSAENNQQSKHLSGLRYNFEFDDILLGEKGEASMMEFNPQSVTVFSEDESSFLFEKPSNSQSNEDSMKDYTDLKFSLLFYDTVLVLAGFSVATISTGVNAAYSFLAGGLCGFSYLLLLEKSVDELPLQELVPSENRGIFRQIFGRLKGSISSLILAFAVTIVAVKFASGEDALKLTPEELIFGMMGFLMCKVSVFLAAFKPMPLSLRDNELGL